MTADQCINSHPTPTASHRDGKGTCKECKRIDGRNRELKRRAAYAVCEGLAAYGVTFMDGDRPRTAQEVAEQLLKVYGDQMT